MTNVSKTTAERVASEWVYARTPDGLLRVLQPISYADMDAIISDRTRSSIVGVPVYWCGSVADGVITVWPAPEEGVGIETNPNMVEVMTDKSQITDPDDYNPAGPVRTFMAKVQFVNAGPMPPMKVEFPMPETTDA